MFKRWKERRAKEWDTRWEALNWLHAYFFQTAGLIWIPEEYRQMTTKRLCREISIIQDAVKRDDGEYWRDADLLKPLSWNAKISTVPDYPLPLPPCPEPPAAPKKDAP